MTGEHGRQPGRPRASVVIATYNRAERLRACLAALALQQRPEEFEVVVVDDGSTDETREVLDSTDAPFALRRIHQENRRQPGALNAGAEAAGGDVLIFLDDDIVVSRQLIACHFALFDDGSAEHPEASPGPVGIGQMDLRVPDDAGWFPQAFAERWRSHYNRLNALPDRATWQDCFGGNISVLRRTFLNARWVRH